ncbi:MAG: GIY-YIG nuclease family protein [Bacteroidota bacterium]
MTCDVDHRLYEHNHRKSKFTAGYVPWKVVHVETFNTHEEARMREKYF